MAEITSNKTWKWPAARRTHQTGRSSNWREKEVQNIGRQRQKQANGDQVDQVPIRGMVARDVGTAAVKTSVWDGHWQIPVSATLLVPAPYSVLSRSPCWHLLQPLWEGELLGNPWAPALQRCKHTRCPYRHHLPGHRPVATREKSWYKSGYWQHHEPVPRENLLLYGRRDMPEWYECPACHLTRFICCIYCWLLSCNISCVIISAVGS